MNSISKLIWLLVILINCLFNCCSQSCSTSFLNETIYAICNGTYTLNNATEECMTNGYQISESFSINTVLSAFK